MLEGDGLDRVISSARRGRTRARGRAIGGDDDVSTTVGLMAEPTV